MIVVFKLAFFVLHFFAVVPAGIRWPVLAAMCVGVGAWLIVRGRQIAAARRAALEQSGLKPLPGGDPRVRG